MSNDHNSFWQLKNGNGGMDGNEDSISTEGEIMARKRVRSSGSLSDESANSTENSPKKAKVQVITLFNSVNVITCSILE